MATTTTLALSNLSSNSTVSAARWAYTASSTELPSTATATVTIIAIISAIHVVGFTFEYAHRIYDSYLISIL